MTLLESYDDYLIYNISMVYEFMKQCLENSKMWANLNCP